MKKLNPIKSSLLLVALTVVMPNLALSQNKAFQVNLPANRAGGTGVDGGGGVSAEQNGKRRLLDLIEKDEVEFITPNMEARAITSRGTDYITYINPLNLLIDISYNLKKMKHGTLKKENNDIGEPTFLYNLLCATDSDFELCTEKYRKDMMTLYKMPVAQPLKWAFTNLDLNQLNDEGLISIENENTKKQVAVQKNGFVLINKKEYLAMDTDSQYCLFIHESVLRSVLLLNPNHVATHGTKYVRAYTRRLVKFLISRRSMPGTPVLPAYPLREAYDAFEIQEKSVFWTTNP